MFREIPPKELVEEILHELGFQGLTDRRTFTKDSIDVAALEEYFPMIEPYYYPCKARILSSATPDTCLTILRQILRPHGVSILSFERTKDKKKIVEYQLMPHFKEELSTILHVDFE